MIHCAGLVLLCWLQRHNKQQKINVCVVHFWIINDTYTCCCVFQCILTNCACRVLSFLSLCALFAALFGLVLLVTDRSFIFSFSCVWVLSIKHERANFYHSDNGITQLINSSTHYNCHILEMHEILLIKNLLISLSDALVCCCSIVSYTTIVAIAILSSLHIMVR